MITEIIALAVVVVTVYLLIKQYETRMVLIGSGLIMCLVALNPMAGFDAFAKSMTSASLIQAICASMGFAYVMKYTTCDMHLVKALTGMMSRLGFFLIPAAVAMTYFINIAIPSAAGCAAAVGATLIPLLIGSRVHPAIAGAAILTGTIGSLLSPGLSHNAFVANLYNEIMAGSEGYTKMEVMDLIKYHAPYSIALGAIGAVSLSIVALVRKEFRVQPAEGSASAEHGEKKEEVRTNYVYATAPFIPLILLMISSTTTWFGSVKMTVPAAMLIGVIYALILTRKSPTTMTKEFFKGMGGAYGDVLGIIIAASVFAAGLNASGLIDSFIYFLTHNPELARWGGTLGPFLMGVLTGSGDAASLAFNDTVTRHAMEFGYTIPDLGMAATMGGAMGRSMSPVSGVAIVCAGVAMVNPIELVKRTAPGVIVSLIFIALILL